jgi:two-component system, OmpR family, alkaline phosphatase synthesis response regulator PhoP
MKVLYQSTDVEKLAGRAEANGTSPDLLLLVLALPETQGLKVWNEILSDLSLHRLPIAVLLARRSEAARALGIKNGISGSLERPSLAHVKSLLRRVGSERGPERVIKVAELVIDPTTFSVSRPGKKVRLTLLEFRLLYYFASHPNRFFTREQLLSALWVSGQDLNARIVDVYVRRLRLKIEPEPENPVHLKTRRGFGYVFAPLVTTTS